MRSFIIYSTIKSIIMRCITHVAGMDESDSANKIFVGKPQGKRPPGILRHR
jgi:hypothetical protein